MLPVTAIMARIAFYWRVAPEIHECLDTYYYNRYLSGLPAKHYDPSLGATWYGYTSERPNELTLVCAIPDLGRVCFTSDDRIKDKIKLTVQTEEEVICQARWDCEHNMFAVDILLELESKDWEIADKLLREVALVLAEDEMYDLNLAMKHELNYQNVQDIKFQAYLMHAFRAELKGTRKELAETRALRCAAITDK